MNFAAPLFLFFFLLVFGLRWVLPRLKCLPDWISKPFLLAGSYFFYMSWNPKFGLLLFGTTVLDYWIGRLMDQKEGRSRAILLSISLVLNIGVLAFFKYFIFFMQSGNAALSAFGLNLSFPVWRIVLPVGISFYTFQSLSYTIDVFRREILPEKNFWNYALFLSFFPQLVAGPIVPAKTFLPQLKSWVTWKELPLKEGLVLILIGVWKKVVIADQLSILPDSFYRSPTEFSSAYAWAAVFAYSLQIYCDFSGYTDIALGCAFLLGFKLTENFRMPYLASGFSDFWRRWHISLSSWLRNYLYIPLGGNRKSELRTYVNLFLTMLLGGLWHGASWNFVVWGGFHGIFLGLERLGKRFWPGFFSPENGSGVLGRFSYRIFVILAVVLCWVFFRSPNWKTTGIVFEKLFRFSSGADPAYSTLRILFIAFFLFFVATWIGNRDEKSGSFRRFYEGLHPVIFGVLLGIGLLFAAVFSSESQPFIYFVF
ncbi:MBOAT family O-acyltransferase [Leptospira andrefontaineae]|uniref:MBOAT family protein n=1 Tax=Leptospira andrefontaineae TaxID=2484976 RepID=A0A4R9H7F9_9LEPT|nr:MBOAT family O-acyltransferase [Leptospira andrefontaineae]TGK41457.1 MBOAT family protein [Leptospira andrefontaineae]